MKFLTLLRIIMPLFSIITLMLFMSLEQQMMLVEYTANYLPLSVNRIQELIIFIGVTSIGAMAFTPEILHLYITKNKMQLLQSAMNSSDNILIVFDEKGKILTKNKTTEQKITETDRNIYQWQLWRDHGINLEKAIRISDKFNTQIKHNHHIIDINITRQVRKNTFILAGNDITHIKKKEIESRKAVLKYREHINNTPLSFIEIDAGGNITDCNKAAEDMFGYSSNEIISRKITETIFKNTDITSLNNIISIISSSESSQHIQLTNTTKDGRKVICEWHITPHFIKNKISRISAIAQNITESIYHLETLEQNEKDAVFLQKTSYISSQATTKEDAIQLFAKTLQQYTDCATTNIIDIEQKTSFFTTDGNTSKQPAQESILQSSATLNEIQTKHNHKYSSMLIPIATWGINIYAIEIACNETRSCHNITDTIAQAKSILEIIIESIISKQEVMDNVAKLDVKIKYSQFLYSAINIMYQPEFKQEDIFPIIVNMLISTMHNPGMACAEIRINKNSYRSSDYEKPHTSEKITINSKDKPIGEILYGYKECENIAIHTEKEEERALFETLAIQISSYIEREVNTQHLNKAIIDAEKANQAKSDFLATMSHEIRTPINGIIGMLDMVKETNLDRNQKSMLETATDSSYSLLNIINDILDFSKIESGKMDVEIRNTNIVSIIEKTLKTLEIQAKSKNVKIFCLITANMPASIETDEVKIRQIMTNIIGNAIKFSSKNPERQGFIKVIADIENTMLKLSFADNGIGMDEKTIAKLFTPFSQEDSSTTRKFGGTGLGLSICKSITEMLNGSISVNSQKGVGSEFIVNLPIGTPTPHKPQTSALKIFNNISNRHEADFMRAICTVYGFTLCTEQHDADIIITGQGDTPISNVKNRQMQISADKNSADNDRNTINLYPGYRQEVYEKLTGLKTNKKSDQMANSAKAERALKILVAEDNETNQEVIRLQIQASGHSCDITENGRIALQHYQDEVYDIVLTDLHMPEMDGLQLFNAIRAYESSCGKSPTPVVILTANAIKGEREKFLDMGVDAYLTKPTNIHELRETINTLCNPHDTASAPTSLITQENVRFNINCLDDYLGDNRSEKLNILRNYMGTSIQTAQQILKACRSHDTAELTETAHKLKSASRLVGGFKLAEICQQLEDGNTQDLSELTENFKIEFQYVIEEISNYIDSQQA